MRFLINSRIFWFVVGFCCAGNLFWVKSCMAKPRPYGFALKLCKEEPEKYNCRRVIVTREFRRKHGRSFMTWEEMFPNKIQRDLVMAINRRDTILWHKHWIAIPPQSHFEHKYVHTKMDYSPFPSFVEPADRYSQERYVMIDLNVLAWAAYENGKLVNWGPANGGKKWRRGNRWIYHTHPGYHEVLEIGGRGTRSNKYPVDCPDKNLCGFQMFYYMKFHRDGTGMHGAKSVPGANISHGCVRLFTEDARWLNKKFVKIGMPIYVEEY